MRYHALATDYDGTLAQDGRVDQATIKALLSLRNSGRKIVLVTGRELPELLQVFPQVELFDRVVAENGALLYRPSTRERRILAPPASKELVHELKRRGVSPISVGEVVIATWRPHEITVFEVIRDLELEVQIVFNKDAVMLLPTGVNKATGLWTALDEIGLSPHNVVGVGDAENDQAFLRLCECSLAVGNALPSVRHEVDWVTIGHRGDGVRELIAQLVESDLQSVEDRLLRHQIPLGVTASKEKVGLTPYGSRILLSGDSGSGKSLFACGLLERMSEAGYQYCLLDPEGEYRHLADTVTLGSSQRTPSVSEITELLERPSQNAAINLLGAAVEHRPAYFDRLLPALIEHGTWEVVNSSLLIGLTALGLAPVVIRWLVRR